jgi:putative phosphoesterase
LAEDDLEFGPLVAEGLREHDYVVDLVTDGAVARDQSTKIPYDVVILDVRIPTLDGLTVCKLLRAYGVRARVLLTSASTALSDGTPVNGRVALAAGADDYLAKPFAFSDLVDRLRALLTPRPVTGSGPRTDRARNHTRTLVISDIHGNFAALEAVAAIERCDRVVCLGDIVGYGPEPRSCVRWIAQHAEIAVQGNHDRALSDGSPPGCRPQFQWLADAMAPLGRKQLAQQEITWLGGLPRWAFLHLSGLKFMFVHATPLDPLYQYLGPDPEAWSRELATIDADIVVVGHTHLQFDLDLGDKRVVNPGSVGQPKDGDPRAAYAVIDEGEVRLGRTPYPVERTVSALAASGAPRAAVEDLTLLLQSGRVPPPRESPPQIALHR